MESFLWKFKFKFWPTLIFSWLIFSCEKTEDGSQSKIESAKLDSIYVNHKTAENHNIQSVTYNCITDSINLALPFGRNEVINEMLDSLPGFKLLCNLPELDKFKCGPEPLNYHQLPDYHGVKCVVVPWQCGDSEYFYLVTFKENKYVSELMISKVQEIEFENEMGLEYITTHINKDHTIELTYSRSTEEYNNRKQIKKEIFKITEFGMFIKK